MDKQAIGKRLMGLRKRHGHSKRTLARIVNCSAGTLTRVESGQASDETTERVGRCICAAYDADWGRICGQFYPVLQPFRYWGMT